MEKNRKLSEAIQLLEIVRHSLNDIAEACESELKLIFKALEISDEDPEKIDDAGLYKIALDLDYNGKEIREEAEDLKSFIDSLNKIKI